MKRVAVILAAGKGTRMRSALPKVLHEVAGRPMLRWVVEAARAARCDQIVVVVGHGSERVCASVEAPDVTFVEQHQQRGTGHALAQAASALEGEGVLLVLSGDVPLVVPATLDALAEAAAGGWGAMAVADLAEPGSLGRVIARSSKELERIVEAADANSAELAIRTVNAGLYCLPFPSVFGYIERLQPDNAKGELYLTDALGDAAGDGQRVALVTLEDPSEAMGVNSRVDLARVDRRMHSRRLERLMLDGVTVLDPDRVRIDGDVEVGSDTLIHAGAHLTGSTRIGSHCTIHQGAWIRDSVLADGVTLLPYSVLDGATIGPNCSIGPFARLRPGTVLEDGAKVGNFVEIKKSTLKAGVKAGHLTYLGDATIGEGANIGAGTVTCNYDGVRKSQTEIGPGAFIGSDTMLVAPVKIGAGAVVGAGSVITKDVPSGALAIERSRQRNLEGWVARRREPRSEED